MTIINLNSKNNFSDIELNITNNLKELINIILFTNQVFLKPNKEGLDILFEEKEKKINYSYYELFFKASSLSQITSQLFDDLNRWIDSIKTKKVPIIILRTDCQIKCEFDCYTFFGVIFYLTSFPIKKEIDDDMRQSLL